MHFDSKFRPPQVGDTIRTVEPLKFGTPTHPVGSYLRVSLPTQAAVEAARKLVASRTWCVEPSPIDQPSDAAKGDA